MLDMPINLLHIRNVLKLLFQNHLWNLRST